MTDIISTLAGLAPGDPVDALRDRRPQARANAQVSFQALFEPADPGTFGLDERLAVALFVAALAEEVLFRGLVLQATAAFTRRILVICAINGVLFAAFHLYANPVVFISLAIAGSLWA